MTSLTRLDLSGCSLTGVLPPGFTKLTNLRTLAVVQVCMCVNVWKGGRGDPAGAAIGLCLCIWGMRCPRTPQQAQVTGVRCMYTTVG